MTKEDVNFEFRDVGSPHLICFGDTNVVSMCVQKELT